MSGLFVTTTKIFLWKHYRYHWMNKRVVIYNFLLPILPSVLLMLILRFTKVNAKNKCSFIETHYYFEFMILLQNMSSINLVLLPIVAEKISGLKEILRIASPHSYMNELLFYCIQVLFGFLIYVIILIVAWCLDVTRHYEMMYMAILVFLYLMANVAFIFLISVFFDSGK